jgi:hypothetical protein
VVKWGNRRAPSRFRFGLFISRQFNDQARISTPVLVSSSYISVCKVKDFIDSLVCRQLKSSHSFNAGILFAGFHFMPLSREEIKKRMIELARKYVETHDKKIIKELYNLGRELEKIDKLKKQ